MNIKTIRKENNLLNKELCKENQGIYMDFASYLRVSNLSEFEQEEVLSDILRMFFDWEKEGKKVKDMIGEDYKDFADEIIYAVKPHKTLLQKCKEYLLTMIEALCYMFTIDFLFLYMPKIVKGNFSLTYDFSLDIAVRVLLIFIVLESLFNYTGRNSFHLSDQNIPKSTRFFIGCGIGCFFITIIFSTILRKINILSIDIRYIIILIIIFWAYKGLKLIIAKSRKKL